MAVGAQIRALREIVENTHASIYLLDEWDANLDTNNRALADDPQLEPVDHSQGV